MIKMLSLRNYRLATTLGDVLLFEAGVPREVPPQCVQAAMAAGIAPVDAAGVILPDDSRRASVEFQGDARRSTIYLAIKAIVDDNKPEQFAGGVPKHDEVSKRLGYTVARDEVGTVYRQFTTAKAEGRDLELHPQAHNIMKVIEADSKDELIELAEEFGMDPKIKGESSRNIRRAILLKFHGAPA
jgi:hypothetical protein